MDGRRPWLKLIGPWLIVLVFLLFFWYVSSKIPVSTLSSPIFIASFVVWLIIARLLAWSLNSIPHVRKRTVPRIAWGLFGILLLTESELGLTLDGLFFALGAGFVGWPLGSSVTLSYMLIRDMKLRYCEHCQTHKYFMRNQGYWYCGVCGKKAPSEEILQSSSTIEWGKSQRST